MLTWHILGRLILNSFARQSWVILTWSLAFWFRQQQELVIRRLEGAGHTTRFLHMLIVSWELILGHMYNCPFHVAWAFSQHRNLSLTSYMETQGSKRTKQKLPDLVYFFFYVILFIKQVFKAHSNSKREELNFASQFQGGVSNLPLSSVH